MEDTKIAQSTKITSITLPIDWWETLKELSTLRQIQKDGADTCSLNAVMVEFLGSGMEDARLELTERRGRKRD